MPILRNPRHERFAQELAAGKSQAEAHVLAGYTANRGNASTLNQNESISKRVTEILVERERRSEKATEHAIELAGVTKHWILARLRDNVERAMQIKAPALDEDGNPTGDFKYDGGVANRALELLGKEIGMFIERREQGKPGEFRELADDALRERLISELVASGVPEPTARAFVEREQGSEARQ